MARRNRPDECRECGRKATRARVISYRGLCPQCRDKRVAESITEMRTKSGPTWELWQRNLSDAMARITGVGVGDRVASAHAPTPVTDDMVELAG